MHSKYVLAIVWVLIVSCVCGQYEQLTQMKLAFETKIQRQHELSEVNADTRPTTFIDSTFLLDLIHILDTSQL